MAERRLSGPARQLVTLLAEHPDGLSLAQLAEYARARFRGLPAARVAALAREAITAGAITDDGGRLRAAAPADDPPEPTRARPRTRATRPAARCALSSSTSSR